MLDILQITAPVFLLAGVGYCWARLGVPFELAFVTRLGVNLATPCLIFSTLATAEIDAGAFGQMALAATAGHLVLFAAFWLFLRAGGLPVRTYLAAMVFANTGNMGLGICLFAFGAPGLALGMVCFAVSAALSFSLGTWSIAGGAPTEALRQPMVWASALGALFAWQGWTVPDGLMNGLKLLGQIAIPLMLVTLGISISLLKTGDVARAAGLGLAKLMICAVAALLVAAALGLEGMPRAVLILQFAMPAPVTAYMIAQRYGADPQSVAGLVVVSTVMSIATVPAVLSILVA